MGERNEGSVEGSTVESRRSGAGLDKVEEDSRLSATWLDLTLIEEAAGGEISRTRVSSGRERGEDSFASRSSGPANLSGSDDLETFDQA